MARRPGEAPELIQVCADATGELTLTRELRALEEAGRIHPAAVKRLLTLTQDAMPAAVPADVKIQPAYEWLLQTA